MELEHQLRELVAYCEWSEPPNVAAADALQAVADALRGGVISEAHARAVADVWEPFVGLEAALGKQPEVMMIADNEDDLRKAIIADLRAMVAKETTPARKLYLARLLNEQVQQFKEARG
jgi:hypothetical protein